MKQLYRCDSVIIASLWQQDVPREGEDDCWVGEITHHYPLKVQGTMGEASGCVSWERVNKWPNSVLA